MRSLRLCLPLLLAACAQPVQVPESQSLPPLPEAEYREALGKGAALYRLDPARSIVLARIGSAGPAKGLGHEHVVASEDVHGLALLTEGLSGSRADLTVPLKLLVVDDSDYRERLGLEAEVPESAVRGTYGNMQKTLSTDNHPVATIRAKYVSGDWPEPLLSVSMTLNGTARDYLVPVTLGKEDGELTISGSMDIRHADFGMTPFTAAGGLLRVAETIELEFELVATRENTVRRR